MKLSLREKALLIALVIVGSGYLFYTFLYSPLSDQRNAMARENNRLKSRIERVADQSGQKSGFAGDARAKQVMKGFQEQVIKVPGESMLPESVIYLQQSAEAAGVTLSSLTYTPGAAASAKPAGSQRPAAVNEIKIRLSAKGGYAGLKTFLLALYQAPRLYRIDTLKLQSDYGQNVVQETVAPALAAEGGETLPPPVPAVINEITMNITMVTFYQEINTSGFADQQKRIQPGPGQINPFAI